MTKIIKLQEFSAIIFDMDGLVLDTETTYSIAWQKASLEMGCVLKDDFCLSMSGLHYQDVEAKLLDFCGTNFDLKLFSQLSGKFWRDYVDQHGIPVKKGFFNLLEVIKARKIPFCLATNSRKLNALECLKLANIDDVFSLIVTRDDVKHGKPAPDIFLAAAKALNKSISKCLILEDSTTGIQAAVNSGACSIFIPSVYPFDLTSANLASHLFNDLDQLAQIINRT